MAKLRKMGRNRNFWTIIMTFVCLALVLAGGIYYVNSLRNSLTDQAISNVLTVTQQHRQAFDTFISGDRERLHSFAQYFSKSDSSDLKGIQEKLDAFAEVDASYSVINLDTGTVCDSLVDETYQMDSGSLETYRSFTGAGIRNLYPSLYTDDLMFGYYECFTFADGTRGMFQKGYNSSKVSEEFSLSFYDGQGLGFVVTRQGDILLRSVDQDELYSMDNVFDIVSQSSGGQSDINSFVRALEARQTGTAMFEGADGIYAFTYVPVENVEDWSLISIVPTDVVTQEADEIIMDSQTMFLIFTLALIVFLAFTILIWNSRRDLEQKDREIDYQEKQFNIFSSYLSSNTDDIYMMIDPEEERVEYISPNVERVLGIPDAEITKDTGRIDTAKYISGGYISFEKLRAMEPGDSIKPMLTERVNAKTQEHRWFRETAYCVSLQGRSKIIAYISDRTNERQTQDTLTQALDMAQVANRAKTTFLGSVSHDIRTPMNAIMGLTMLLRDEADNPERVREYTQRIDAASQHLLGLINDVLDMNKIEGGNTTLNISEITLPDIIDELNTIIRPQTRAKNQEFKITASSFTYEHLLGDKLRINQILINILSNAVKYTPEGGKIELSVIEMPQRMKDHSHVKFMVRDNGQGMGEDYLKVIFDPFTREQNSSTNLIQGTGLGMAITKSLVELMGGAISVESELGKGSTFIVELEFRIQEREDDKEFWKANAVKRMIVADDEEEVCLNVVKAMAQTGVTVHYATSGQEAIRTMREARERGEPYDLILLDWKMPDLDGLETARLIRKNYPAKIPILFFTAYDWRDIEQEAIDIGVNHFLPKPFFMYSFKKAITRVMGGADKEPAPEKADNVVTGRHFLVVDDVEVNRMILVKILNTLGAVCDTAENGQEALDKFTASQPGEYDIILMDVQMPVMDGHAATRAIRASAHPEAKSVSIIAMTANAFVDDVRDALASGMDAHVSKPIVLDQLKRTIQEVLARKDQCEINIH